jgi:gas vesicle protein
MSNGKLILGVAAGLVAGVVIGLLCAPAEGSETRKKFAAKGSDTMEELKNNLNELLAGIDKLTKESSDTGRNSGI